MEWLKLNREIATATYDSVVKVYDEDLNICEKGLRLVIDETKKTMKLNRDVVLQRNCRSLDPERGAEGAGRQIDAQMPTAIIIRPLHI